MAFNLAEVQTIPPLKLNDSHQLFSQVQTFLVQYGYLESGSYQSGTLDKKTSDAIRLYQNINNIPETGNWDNETLKLVTTPRCGMSEAFPLTVSTRRDAQYTNSAWHRRDITYAFLRGTTKLQKAEVRKAAEAWTATGCVNLIEVSHLSLPDLTISWTIAQTPEHRMIDGVIAHADFPPGSEVSIPGLPNPIHFNQEYEWVVGSDPIHKRFNIYQTALHEIGHALGLEHNATGQPSIMHPYYQYQGQNITEEDLRNLHQLYPPKAVHNKITYKGCMLMPGQQLQPNEGLLSPDNYYAIIYQHDGNLCLKDGRPRLALFQSETGTKQVPHTPGCLFMNPNGNLEIHDHQGTTMWQSHTIGHPNAFLIMNNDRTATIKDATGNHILWHSGTSLREDPYPPFPLFHKYPEYKQHIAQRTLLSKIDQLVIPANNVLRSGYSLYPGNALTSANRFFQLYYDPKGKLIFRDANGKIYWESKHHSPGKLTMQTNGNLVLTDLTGEIVFQSDTDNHPGAYLAMQSFRTFKVRSKDNTPLWKPEPDFSIPRTNNRENDILEFAEITEALPDAVESNDASATASSTHARSRSTFAAAASHAREMATAAGDAAAAPAGGSKEHTSQMSATT